MLQPLRRLAGKIKRGIAPPPPPPPTPEPVEHPRVMTAERFALHEEVGAEFGVLPVIHPDDFIYWHLTAGRAGAALRQEIAGYLGDGRNAARQFAEWLGSLQIPANPIRVLEFASGYGRVTRGLKNFPQLQVVASDIHPQAVEFLQQQIGVPAILSSAVPEQFRPTEKFHAVYALSFFTHLPDATFSRWLKALYDTLEIGGYLIFTTHGYESLRLAIDQGFLPKDYRLNEGFAYFPGSEQKDLPSTDYGTCYTGIGYLVERINALPGSRIARVIDSGRFHQDVWFVQKTA